MRQVEEFDITELEQEDDRKNKDLDPELLKA